LGAQVGVRSAPESATWIIKAVFGPAFLHVSLKFILIMSLKLV